MISEKEETNQNNLILQYLSSQSATANLFFASPHRAVQNSHILMTGKIPNEPLSLT
jgi:hypothetical protein